MPLATDRWFYFYVTLWSEVPAVYIVSDISGRVIYVGQTDNLKRRMSEYLADRNHRMHRYAPYYVAAEVNYGGEFVRRAREAQLIAEYDPPANRTTPPIPLISPELLRLLGIGSE